MTSPATADTRECLLDLDLEALSGVLSSFGEPAYRARQIWQAVHQRFLLSFDDMTELPRALRMRLDERLRIAPAEMVGRQDSEDGSTTKTLLRMPDGELIESVLMRYDPFEQKRPRMTVCVSTQAGCAMGCSFCATGAQGYRRQLTTGEVIYQVLAMAGVAAENSTAKDKGGLTNVVLMGMGEPLANYEVTDAVLTRLSDPEAIGMSPRRITVSTVGLLPGIRQLAQDHPQVNLAISLHAGNDALRRRLVPVPTASVAEIIAAAREHVETTGRRVSFEWVLLAGVNDSPRDARELAVLLRRLRCHVNLIPMNAAAGTTGERPARSRVLAFQTVLEEGGIPATVRVEKGRDIAAACGQLRGDRTTSGVD